ncbi:MAG TPA: SDR family oxidoreductase [Flavobacteriales bacterium]|nr:SDR family oxidoreductase [Flavobacteriales bacterium]HNU55112.1 SDR family oxidoreductase [Flavobacteriales bacterium]
MAIGTLTGQNALVCGGTQGIGRAVAHELARLGATVTILARDPRALDEVRSSLPVPAGQVHQALPCDMADTVTLGAAMAGLVSERPIDILVNNTGGPSPGPAHEAEAAAFLAAFTQHLIGFQTIVRAVVPGMKVRGHGRIINVISTSVKQPLPNLGVSNTIRGAVANWGKTLANELGPFHITVNNVLPGATSTDRLKAIIQAKASRTGSSEDEVRTEMLAEIPLRRFAEPAEIAAAVAFLVGPSAAYINGINLPVDGGRTSCL